MNCELIDGELMWVAIRIDAGLFSPSQLWRCTPKEICLILSTLNTESWYLIKTKDIVPQQQRACQKNFRDQNLLISWISERTWKDWSFLHFSFPDNSSTNPASEMENRFTDKYCLSQSLKLAFSTMAPILFDRRVLHVPYKMMLKNDSKRFQVSCRAVLWEKGRAYQASH